MLDDSTVTRIAEGMSGDSFRDQVAAQGVTSSPSFPSAWPILLQYIGRFEEIV